MRVGLPVHLFRLAGIYGPGRSALDTVRSGTAKRIVKPGQVFSRIHVDDIAGVLRGVDRQAQSRRRLQCLRRRPGAAAGRHRLCRALCLASEPPPEVPYAQAAPSMSEMARSFYADSKRVANTRIKIELGVRLAYPGLPDRAEGAARRGTHGEGFYARAVTRS